MLYGYQFRYGSRSWGFGGSFGKDIVLDKYVYQNGGGFIFIGIPDIVLGESYVSAASFYYAVNNKTPIELSIVYLSKSSEIWLSLKIDNYF
jgi:hypothetical protein